jgi:hypothetical protein
LAQYLHDEQKKVLDLWAELQRVRRQFSELKEQTEKELEQQRREFNRILKSLRTMGGGEIPASGMDFQSGGKTINTDTLIIEFIRRLRERSGKYIPDLDLLNKMQPDGGGGEFSPELYKELIKKY